MKQFFSTLLLLLFTATVWAQAPQAINYQGVARNASGIAYAGQQINVRLSIHTNTPDGTIEYRETRIVITNQFGLFNVQIGSPGASAVQGNFTTINWAIGAKFLQTEVSVNGQPYSNLGTTQMMSVPFAINSLQTRQLIFPYDTTVTSNSNPAFSIKNNAVGQSPAINGESINGNGIVGVSEKKSGIAGYSYTTGIGAVTGVNGTLGGYGVHGYTSGTNTTGAGVLGQALNGTGVKGETSFGEAIWGLASANGTGVRGQSNSDGKGVYGSSGNGTGVLGEAYGSTGVAGKFVQTISTGKALEVVGNVKISGGNTSPGSGKILTSDANGNATWQAPTAVPSPTVGFLATGAAQGGLQIIPNSKGYKIHLATEEYDGSNNFSLYNQTPSSTFTAPVDGLYRFTTFVLITSNDVVGVDIDYSVLDIIVKRNGIETDKGGSLVNEGDISFVSHKIDKVLYLKAGDQVWLKIFSTTSDGSNPELNYAEFTGYLIK